MRWIAVSCSANGGSRGESAMKTVNLALQGGGAHGAFAWGVLDCLLKDGRVAFEGVSATSAGAMNAVVLSHGLTVGGRDGARQELHDFWFEVSRAAIFNPFRPTPIDYAMGNSDRPMVAHAMLEWLTRNFSPYQFNPLNLNPLRDLLEERVDFDRLQHHCAVKLFLSATNVRSGKIKVFKDDELILDAVMASACLPFLFQAVEIDGEAYWDGGYMGNPAIFPLIYHCDSRDVVIAHINPLARDEVPKEPTEIMDRLNEITFNSSLMREMRAIAFVTKLIDDGDIHGRALKRMLIHSIEADDFMRSLGLASKLNPGWGFLKKLRDIGRETAGAWLERTYGDIGKRSSVDLEETYL